MGLRIRIQFGKNLPSNLVRQQKVEGNHLRKHFCMVPLDLLQRTVMSKLRESVPEWTPKTNHPPVIHPSDAMKAVAVRETTVYIRSNMVNWR